MKSTSCCLLALLFFLCSPGLVRAQDAILAEAAEVAEAHDHDHVHRSSEELQRGMQRSAVLSKKQVKQLSKVMEGWGDDSIEAASQFQQLAKKNREELEFLSDDELAACLRMCEYYLRPADDHEEDEQLEQAIEWAAVAPNVQGLQVLERHAIVRTALARRVCDLEEEQLQALKDMDQKWLQEKAADKGKAREVRGIVAGMARFLGGRIAAPGQQQDQPQAVVQRVRPIIDEHVLSILDDEQKEAYQAELEAMETFERESMASVIVASLDARIYLQPDQRKSLIEEIQKWLEGRNRIYWQFYFQNTNYIPDIPSNILKKHLTEAQYSSINGLQKYNYDADQIEWQVADATGIIDDD